MSGIVADEGQGPRIVSRQEFDRRIGVERIAEIGDHAVPRHRDDAFGQEGEMDLATSRPVVPAG